MEERDRFSVSSATPEEVIRETYHMQMAFGSLLRGIHWGWKLSTPLISKGTHEKIREQGA